MTSQNPLLSIKDVGVILGVNHRTVRNYIDAGKLKAYRVGGHIRVRSEDVEQFITPYPAKSQSPVSVALASHEQAVIEMREEHGLTF